MSDESIPMDQEEEDNDEFFSARESQKKGSQESLNSPALTPLKSDRDGGTNDSTPSSRKSSSSRSEKNESSCSDEKGQESPDKSAKKSKKVRRMLKDRNRWDMREYKKEELEPPAKPKKKKKKNKAKRRSEAEEVKEKEKSKTDEESEEKEEKEPGMASEREEVQPRPFFQSTHLILNMMPKARNICSDTTMSARSAILGDGRWGAHRELCDQGGFIIDKHKKAIDIKRGSDPPPCPPNPRQVTLNKNFDAPDSQTMMGSIRVEVGPAEEEVHRIGRVIEDYVVKQGGFVPPPMMKNDLATLPKQTMGGGKGVKGGGKPVVVVHSKTTIQKPPKAKNNKKNGSESDSVTDDDSTAEKGRKNKEIKDDSKAGRFAFFKRSKQPANKAKEGRRNNKGISR